MGNRDLPRPTTTKSRHSTILDIPTDDDAPSPPPRIVVTQPHHSRSTPDGEAESWSRDRGRFANAPFPHDDLRLDEVLIRYDVRRPEQGRGFQFDIVRLGNRRHCPPIIQHVARAGVHQVGDARRPRNGRGCMDEVVQR